MRCQSHYVNTLHRSIMSNNASKTAISCLQVNLNHSKLAQDCIANKIKALNNKQTEFIICVQEPYVYGSKHARKPKSCNTYCSDDSPRTAIYLSKNLIAWYIESLSTRDITCLLYTSPSPRDS